MHACMLLDLLTGQPSSSPSSQPTAQPSDQPTGQPSALPSVYPSNILSSNNEADEFNIVVMSIVGGIIFVVTVVVTWALCKISRKKVGVLVAGAAYQDTDHELRSAEFELIAIKKQQARIVPSDDMDGDVEEVGDSLLLGV